MAPFGSGIAPAVSGQRRHLGHAVRFRARRWDRRPMRTSTTRTIPHRRSAVAAVNVGRLSAGPISQESLDARHDLVRYTGRVVAEPLDIVGTVSATLFVSSSAVDTDFFVKLLDVDPTGVAVAICEGGVRLRYRCGFDHEEPYSPGEVARLDIDLGHTAWRVLPGHRLALQVQSANFPQLDPNPNTGERLGDSATSVMATNSVHRGEPASVPHPVRRDGRPAVTVVEGELLWTPTPERIAEAPITAYTHWLERERGHSFASYDELWQWSTTEIEDFWASLWDYFDIRSDRALRPGAGQPDHAGREVVRRQSR